MKFRCPEHSINATQNLQQPGRLKQTTNTGLEAQSVFALMISPDTDRREVAARSIGCVMMLQCSKNKMTKLFSWPG